VTREAGRVCEEAVGSDGRLTDSPPRRRRRADIVSPDHPPENIDFFLTCPIDREENMSTKANTPIKLKRLVLSSVLYLIWASIGAVVAIVLNLPARFGGSTSGLPVV
jgi:hypothetical protein